MSIKSSEYINNERRAYALYVLQQRAIPHFADGLKSAGRRVLWIARDGKKHKTATLAGATMPIHPHSSPEGSINTLTAPYTNNVALFNGYGAFGTLLKPQAYGAARYTSVAASQFTKDVVYADIELVPMTDNYDETLEEPKHFLPLVPLVLVNPSEGIAVGFASTILPRCLSDVVSDQIKFLEGNGFRESKPQLVQIGSKSTGRADGGKGWMFEGELKRVNSTTIKVTNLPYGLSHQKFVDTILPKLLDEEKIVDVDDGSVDVYDIDIKFKRGQLSQYTDDELLDLLGLKIKVTENTNMINFDGETVVNYSYVESIQKYTEWRLEWYLPRYERLLAMLEIDIQRYKDVLLAIKKNIGGAAKKISSKAELITLLTEIGIVHTDYIASLPVYRFTEEERKKTEAKLKEAQEVEKKYKKLIRSKAERTKVYIQELKDVLSNYKKGVYKQELEL